MKKLILSLTASAVLFASCSSSDDDTMVLPTDYTFENVSYSGQTTRLDMLSELSTLLKTGNTSGTTVDATTAKNMFSNTDSPFSDADLNASTKSLSSKTFTGEDAVINAFIDSVAVASTSSVAGSNGQAGVVESADGAKAYLFAANGYEYTQLVEKGIMGSVLYYQMTAVYLSEDKIGAAVDNTMPVDEAAGKLYTAKQHHWDEAFGYLGVPTDFPTNTTDVRFLGKYVNSNNGVLQNAETLMDGFIAGRFAIDTDDQEALDAAVVTVRDEMERSMAGAAIHYLNGALADITDDALRNHQLSEAYAFIYGLKFSPNSNITSAQVDSLLSLFGDNLYEISTTDINTIKDTLSTYFSMDSIKDTL